MKKYILVLFLVFAFALFGFSVSTVSADTTVPGCMPGYLYSATTGQSCDTTPAIVECAPGDLFSVLTGKPCSEVKANGSSGDQTSIVGQDNESEQEDLSSAEQDNEGEVEIEELPNQKISCKLPSDLGVGSKNDSVYLLQTALRDGGYYPEGLVTGYYGKLTNKAVKKFESENENEDLNSLIKQEHPKECDPSSSSSTNVPTSTSNSSPVISGSKDN